MNTDILYNICFPLLFAIISGVIPIIVTAILKCIKDEGWGVEIDESAKKTSRKMIILMFKGELFCLICSYIFFYLKSIGDITVKVAIFCTLTTFLYCKFCLIKVKKFVLYNYILTQVIIIAPLVLLAEMKGSQMVEEASGFIAATTSFVLYNNLKFVSIKNKRKSLILYACCILFAVACSKNCIELLFDMNRDISIVVTEFLLLLPLVCFVSYERLYYEQIYKYSKVNIHLKNHEIVSGLKAEGVCKKDDWLVFCRIGKTEQRNKDK